MNALRTRHITRKGRDRHADLQESLVLQIGMSFQEIKRHFVAHYGGA